MIEVQPISRDYPENAWSFSKSPDGTIKLTRRTRGKATELAADASAIAPGSIVEVSSDDTMPFSGTFVVESVSLEWDGPGWATLTRVYSSKNNGGSFTLGGSEDKAEVTEVLDVQTLEKPIATAPFWRDAFPETCEGSGADSLEAMKRVQLYIDAPTLKEAEEVKKTFKKTDAEMTMAKKRMQGIEAYYVPAPVLSRTETTTKVPTGVGSEVAKIVTRPDVDKVPVPSGMKWLGGGERITWNGTVYTYERTWIGADYWDEDLYKEAKKNESSS